MSRPVDRPRPQPPRHDPRLRAVEAWRLLREEEDLAAGPLTREDRLDSERHLRALRREADTLYAQLACPGTLPAARPTAVVVSRRPWLCEQLHVSLGERGIDVVGHTDDGAEGSGLTIAHTPTLLLLEGQLSSMTGVELARRVARCSPDTIVTARVSHRDDRAALVDAGAVQVWGRDVLPIVLATDLVALVQHRAATSGSGLRGGGS